MRGQKFPPRGLPSNSTLCRTLRGPVGMLVKGGLCQQGRHVAGGGGDAALWAEAAAGAGDQLAGQGAVESGPAHLGAQPG